jgi:hypothetical protein
MQAITLEKIENKGNQIGQTKFFFFSTNRFNI